MTSRKKTNIWKRNNILLNRWVKESEEKFKIPQTE